MGASRERIINSDRLKSVTICRQLVQQLQPKRLGDNQIRVKPSSTYHRLLTRDILYYSRAKYGPAIQDFRKIRKICVGFIANLCNSWSQDGAEIIKSERDLAQDTIGC